MVGRKTPNTNAGLKSGKHLFIEAYFRHEESKARFDVGVIRFYFSGTWIVPDIKHPDNAPVIDLLFL